MTSPVLSGEQTMTAGALLAAHEAGRTQYMDQRIIPGAIGSNGQPMWQSVVVTTAELNQGGAWRKVEQVATDLNDEAEPVFIDLLPRQRVVLTMSDSVTVRGLIENQ